MRTTRTLLAVLPVACLLTAGCGGELDEIAAEEALPADLAANDGNKLRGAHYNLNIIGVPQGKTADMTGDNGHRIFVPRVGSARISLKEGAEFNVLDANGTDGNGAAFQLPNPDPDGDGTTTYSVFARALGKPGGSSSMTTCFTDLTGTYCSIYSSVQVRGTGKSSFENVSKQLLYAYVDTNLDGVLERYSIFSDALADYYWQYDNNGLHLLQLRFYEQIKTTVPDPVAAPAQ